MMEGWGVLKRWKGGEGWWNDGGGEGRLVE